MHCFGSANNVNCSGSAQPSGSSTRAQDAKTNITRAEYSVNGGDWKLAAPVSGLSDSLEEDYDVTIPGNGGMIAVRVTDDFDNTSVARVLAKP